MVELISSLFTNIVELDQTTYEEKLKREKMLKICHSDGLHFLENGQVLMLIKENGDRRCGGFICYACGEGNYLSNYILAELPIEGTVAYHQSCFEETLTYLLKEVKENE